MILIVQNFTGTERKGKYSKNPICETRNLPEEATLPGIYKANVLAGTVLWFDWQLLNFCLSLFPEVTPASGGCVLSSSPITADRLVLFISSFYHQLLTVTVLVSPYLHQLGLLLVTPINSPSGVFSLLFALFSTSPSQLLLKHLLYKIFSNMQTYGEKIYLE